MKLRKIELVTINFHCIAHYNENVVMNSCSIEKKNVFEI